MSDTASEIARLRAALAASEARAEAAESELAQTRAVVSTSEAMIKHLKLEIAKLRREHYGRGSERRARLIDQMELQLEELEAATTEDEISAMRLVKTTIVTGFERRRPARKPFPEHLPRERVVIAAPTACSCCGSDRIVKMGEDITETLEVLPRQWKVVQTVREKFTCRTCERISQPPAPFHPTPRGWAGPHLLAMILFEKFGQHQPLNRQAERYAKEGVEISLSTLADQVGACAAALEPIHAVIRAHVLDAERLHGDDTTVPLLAKGGTHTARLWTYVRDDRPFGGGAPPAEVIQAAMGWTDTHLYEFRVGEAGWGVPDPDGFYDGPMPAKKATLEKVLEDTGARTIQYVYDFGDDWDHSIRIERINEATPGITYPRLLKATGACPPEDVGGAGGYEEFLEALADPDHEQHGDMVRWSGGSFDPEDARIERIVERFDQLAKKWAPRPSKPKASKPMT